MNKWWRKRDTIELAFVLFAFIGMCNYFWWLVLHG